MARAEFYLVEIETGKVLERWPCGGLSREERAELGRKLMQETGADDPDRGIDLRDTFTDARAPWE
jgi:hypothetical protein